ncbi:MAG: hypothetical protein ACRDGS_03035 [Chloroflexota bacterium]
MHTRVGAAALLAVCVLASPEAANASGPRWYGVAAWYNATTNIGSHVDMYVSQGSCVDWASGGFIAQVLWQGTDSNSGLNDWVEEGQSYGFDGKNISTFYWADNRPGIGYREHEITDIRPSVGSTYDVEIYWYTTNWIITLNSSVEGDSTSNPLYGKALETGLESTSPNSSMPYASSFRLSYRTSGSGWVTGWGNGTGIIQNSPAFAYWNLQNVNLNDGM